MHNTPPQDELVIIKKYANRRLYNTETSAYVTLEDLAQMVRDNREFEVVDARTGRDITHQVLTQIIFDEETKGSALLPIKFLRQLIRFYDDSIQTLVPQYLETTMDMLTKNQEKLAENAHKMFGANPFLAASQPTNLADIQRRNMELFEKTFTMFNPFASFVKDAPTSKDAQLAELQEQMKKLNAEIERLKKS